MSMQLLGQTRSKTDIHCITPVRTRMIQRKCCEGKEGKDEECAECRERRLGLQRHAISGTAPGSVPPVVYEVLQSSGQPLDSATRGFMEQRFGHDFSGVKVHLDANAAESARAVDALAYTVGDRIVFGSGQYALGTSRGQRLLAHELAHVVQQNGNGARWQRETQLGLAEDRYEIEADALAERALENELMEAPSKTAGSRRLFRQVERLGVRGTAVPQLEIVSPSTGDTFHITAAPAMPTLSCNARITGVEPDPTPSLPFEWRLEILETVAANSCASAGIGECRQSWSQQVTGGGWTPNFGGTILGGEATLTARATVHGTTLTNQVTDNHVRGTNPGAASITARAGGAGTAADWVACHESGRRQFNASGMPLLGPGGDVGAMQLCNPPATCPQRWNWHANVDAGVTLLGQKQTAATNYLNTHVVNGNYPNNLNLSNQNVLLRETLQRYNGGRYWTWNTANNRWENNPPNNYVARVLACT